MEFHHIPVMLHECMEGLNIQPEGIYVDGTAGGAGHSSEIAKRLTKGRLIALDQDPDAIAAASERLKPYPAAQVIRANFRNMAEVLAELSILRVNGVLLDLGVSSRQLDTAERGFSYQKDAPLDMRMSQEGMSAADLVNTASVEELARILREYGEEKFAFSIAKAIARKRESVPSKRRFSWRRSSRRRFRRRPDGRKTPANGHFRRCGSPLIRNWMRFLRDWMRRLTCWLREGGFASSPSIRWKTGW